MVSFGEKRVEDFGVVLEEGSFNASCGLGEKRKSQKKREDADRNHLRIVSQIF